MTEKATFAAGCFWGVQDLFDNTPGVLSTRVGYTGGSTEYKNPTYKQVCSDATGHAEAIEITFDPEKVTYKQLVEIFFKSHNPTTLNRQGPDVGSQYRSAIFYHSPKQKEEATKTLSDYQKVLGPQKKIVTQIMPAQEFYPAEDYHQKYLQKNGLASCHI